LDIDALRVVAGGESTSGAENAIIVVTHYQRLLNILCLITCVLANGRIAKEGGKELALELEEKGYDWIKADTQETGRALSG
jgi:Fe-S cluster assembly ATP-binding protein